MAQQRIWTGIDADVLLYLSDANGNRINLAGNPWAEADGPLLQYCYFRDCNLDGNLPATRRPVTGRPRLRIVVTAWEYTLDVKHFYLHKSTELDTNRIFNREQWLEVVLRLEDQQNPVDTDPHTLKLAKATTFQITGRDNENMEGNAKFSAEQFV